MCAKLGVEPDFVEINWDTKVVELDAKSIDCIWNGMTLTDDIMANTACTKPYAKNAQVVVMKADAAYSSADLVGQDHCGRGRLAGGVPSARTHLSRPTTSASPSRQTA